MSVLRAVKQNITLIGTHSVKDLCSKYYNPNMHFHPIKHLSIPNKIIELVLHSPLDVSNIINYISTTSKNAECIQISMLQTRT